MDVSTIVTAMQRRTIFEASTLNIGPKVE
jgi:hypothetical protein